MHLILTDLSRIIVEVATVSTEIGRLRALLQVEFARFVCKWMSVLAQHSLLSFIDFDLIIGLAPDEKLGILGLHIVVLLLIVRGQVTVGGCVRYCPLHHHQSDSLIGSPQPLALPYVQNGLFGVLVDLVRYLGRGCSLGCLPSALLRHGHLLGVVNIGIDFKAWWATAATLRALVIILADP